MYAFAKPSDSPVRLTPVTQLRKREVDRDIQVLFAYNFLNGLN